MRVKISLIILAIFVNPVTFSQNQSDSVYFAPLKKKVFLANKPDSFEIKKDKIIITAGTKTNLFSSPDGLMKENNAPKVQFEADRNFIFSVKITSSLKSKWDGGVLLVEYDADHWAKLCFEKDYKGIARLVSVVNNVVSDDCNSEPIKGNSVFLRIAKKGDVIFFYYSMDNKEFYLIRNFKFPFEKLKLAFLAQSPIGEGNQVEFSEVFYNPEELKDFWKGF